MESDNQFYTKNVDVQASNNNIKYNPRQTWVFENKISNLITQIKTKENLNFTKIQAFDAVLSADPSTNSSAAQWIIECYCRNGFRWEDMEGGSTSKVSDTLSLFGKYKKHLPIEQRNVYQYRTLAELYTSIKTYHLTELEQVENSNLLGLKGRALKRSEKQTALENSCILLDQKELKIVIPLTKEASEWWGKGTRWCTAAQNNNHFKTYNSQAPLIIVLSSKSNAVGMEKYQFWISESEIQIMNARDEPLSVEFVLQNWDIFEPIIQWGLNLNGMVIEYMPNSLKNKELYAKAVKSNYSALDLVPLEYRSPDLCLQAAESSPYAIDYIPRDRLTHEICSTIVKRSGNLILQIPEWIVDDQIRMLAVAQNGRALRYIYKQLLTKELCVQAVTSQGTALEFVPQKFVDRELCQLACKEDGLAIEFVPEIFRDQKMYNIAFEQTVFSLLYFPQHMKTEQLIIQAVEKNSGVINDIPEELRTHDVYLAAVKQNWSHYLHMPKKHKSEQIYNIVLQQNGLAIFTVPKEDRTPKLCKLALQHLPPHEKSNLQMIQAIVDDTLDEYQEWQDYKNKNLSFLREISLTVKNQEWDLSVVQQQFKEVLKQLKDNELSNERSNECYEMYYK